MGAKNFWSNSSSDLMDCRLFISTKCAGMGREGKLHTRYPADCLHFFLHLLSLPGISKDVWELSQMLGRGGRGGENAAFVVLRWVGQAGT